MMFKSLEGEMRKINGKRSNVIDVLLIVMDKIKRREPMSLIRLGDGEGRFLGYPDFVMKEGGEESLNYTLQILLGRTNFSKKDLRDLSNQLRRAVKDADIIGLPRERQYSAHIAYKYVLDAIKHFHLVNQSQLITDAAIHRYLQFGLFYKEILYKRDFVGLVTGRLALAKIIKRTFEIEEVKSYLLPAEAAFPGGEEGEHYPDHFYNLKQKLSIPYKGAVFLVGAGVLGKIYCAWIKEKGGVAIDIGSICDSWSEEGRLQHKYHKIKIYSANSVTSFESRVGRFNQACDFFCIDTPRLTSDDLVAFECLSQGGVSE